MKRILNTIGIAIYFIACATWLLCVNIVIIGMFIALSGCEKDNTVVRNRDIHTNTTTHSVDTIYIHDGDGDGSNGTNNGTSWSFNPGPLVQWKTATQGTNGYTYYLKVPLGNSQMNPNGRALEIPHVNNGAIEYANATGSATYSATSDGSYVYITVTTSNATLEFNLSINVNGTHIWFLAYGNYTKIQNYIHDDGLNNVYRIKFQDGTIYNCW
jgi:hypothetical protein